MIGLHFAPKVETLWQGRLRVEFMRQPALKMTYSHVGKTYKINCEPKRMPMNKVLKTFQLFTTLLILIVSASANVFAGDFATRNILGFSKDGSRFAFEEYGVQDGSGFPYSNIYLIDTKTDSWVEGSPWRARFEDEEKSVNDARTLAKKLAGDALNQITEKGFIAATNRYTEINDDPNTLKAHPRSYIPSGVSFVEYSLVKYKMDGPEYCSGFGEVKGFRLLQSFPTGSKSALIIHEDKGKLPKSRQCALDYRFADLITYYPKDSGIDAPPVAAILILVETVGFEGPDGRYIAITTSLGNQ